MADGDFDTINALSAERSDIRMICSSTPSGHRGKFYELCTDKALGFSLHHHPSQHNPCYTKEMDEKFRRQLSESGYQHEILAEFGNEEAGVFNKGHVDNAITLDNYSYKELADYQRDRCIHNGTMPRMLLYDREHPYRGNPFICIGVDNDKYQAGSSILVLEYDRESHLFRVINAYEVPQSEYSYDNEVNKIIEFNEIYNPAWIYMDKGAGDYQLERLHMYGDDHPESGLKVKVKGWQFANVIELPDPITHVVEKKPMKPFMVNQLAAAFEHDRIILSPFDETIHKQLIDYTVERITSNGVPIYTSKNEHFVDALGLAYLAFVLEFPNLTQAIKTPSFSSHIYVSNKTIGAAGSAQADISRMEKISMKNPWKGVRTTSDMNDPRELDGDKQKWIKVPMKSHSIRSVNPWGSRSSRGGGGNYRKGW